MIFTKVELKFRPRLYFEHIYPQVVKCGGLPAGYPSPVLNMKMGGYGDLPQLVGTFRDSYANLGPGSS